MVDESTDLHTRTRSSHEVPSPTLTEPSQTISLQNKDETENSEAPEVEAQKHEYPSGIERALILGPVTLTYFLWFLDLAVVSTATPAITSEFNSLVDVGWYAWFRSHTQHIANHTTSGMAARTSLEPRLSSH